jgi:alcohol dehydrogenase
MTFRKFAGMEAEYRLSMTSFDFNTCRTLVNNPGACSRLGELCQGLGIARPLLVTDRGIESAGLLERALQPLAAAGLDVTTYCDVVPDPPESVVLEAVQVARQAQVDGVIGFGGGSTMDTAKLVALLSCSGESLGDIYGVEQVQGERFPLVLVPTTAGTGSEVTPVAIVTTGEDSKMGVSSARLIPDVALLDAELTLGLPAHVTASTGVDAMVHAIEAYTSRHRKNAYSDMLARQALQLMSRHLLRAVQQPQNLEARQAMLLGAMLAGQAFANAPVAAVHALAYPLGGRFHISHGLSNSLVLPAVLRFNSEVAAAQYAQLAPHILPGDPAAGSDEELAAAVVAHMVELIEAVGLPPRLRDVDIPESALEGLARDAMEQQRLLVNNPREVSFDDALAIYRASY